MYRFFYPSVWFLQIVASLMLFAISFWLQANILTAYITPELLAYGLALAMELTKVLTIILFEIYRHTGNPHRSTVKIATALLRSGLLTLSALATLMFFATAFDRPLLNSIRQADLTAEHQQHQRRIQQLNQALNTAITQEQHLLQQALQQQSQQLARDHQPSIKRLQTALTDEMEIKDSQGNFIGKRYRAIQARLEQAQQDFTQARQQLSDQHATTVRQSLNTIRNHYAELHVDEQQRHTQKIATIRTASYSDDERADKPETRALRNTLQQAFGIEIKRLVLALSIALFIALLIELCIFVGFAYIGHYVHNAFKAGERLHKKQTEADEELASYAVDSRAKMQKSKIAVDNILQTPSPT